MAAKIEIEIRGPLKKAEFLNLKKFMEKNGEFLREGDRFSLMYFRDYIPKNLLEIEDEKIDLRLRVTNKKAELTMKYGHFEGNNTRKEFSFFLPLNKFDEMTEFLRHLGWKIGVINATKTYVYDYNGVEFSLGEIKGFGYYYEAEILTESEEKVDKFKKKILDVCKELNLRQYKKEEFNKQCNEINNTKELQFNFDERPFSEIKSKFKEFF